MLVPLLLASPRRRASCEEISRAKYQAYSWKGIPLDAFAEFKTCHFESLFDEGAKRYRPKTDFLAR